MSVRDREKRKSRKGLEFFTNGGGFRGLGEEENRA